MYNRLFNKMYKVPQSEKYSEYFNTETRCPPNDKQVFRDLLHRNTSSNHPTLKVHEFSDPILTTEQNQSIDVVDQLLSQNKLKTEALEKASKIITMQREEIQKLFNELQNKDEKIIHLQDELTLKRKDFSREYQQKNVEKVSRKTIKNSQENKKIKGQMFQTHLEIERDDTLKEIGWTIVKEKIAFIDEQLVQLSSLHENEASNVEEIQQQLRSLEYYVQEEILTIFRNYESKWKRQELYQFEVRQTMQRYEQIIEKYDSYSRQLKISLYECLESLKNFAFADDQQSILTYLPKELFIILIKQVKKKHEDLIMEYRMENFELRSIAQEMIVKLKSQTPKTTRY